MAKNPETAKLVTSPTFYSLPWDERKQKISAVDPEFAGLPPQEQDVFIQTVASKYAPKESTLESIGHDLNLGWRSGVSQVERTVGNALSFVPITRQLGQKIHETALATAPKPQEMEGRDSLSSEILQGVGAAPAAIAQYAPAMAAKRYAPFVAGAIGATQEADKGTTAALTEGLKSAANFYLMGKAATLPTRTARTIGGGILTALPTAIESGGDIKKTTSAFILGGAMSAIPGKPAVKASKTPAVLPGKQPKFPRIKSEQGALESLGTDLKTVLSPMSLSAEGHEQGKIVIANRAHLARKAEIVENQFQALREKMEKLPYDKTNPGGMSDYAIDWVNNIETGRISKIDAAERPYAQAMRQGNDDRFGLMSKAKDYRVGKNRVTLGPMLETYTENYMGRLWTRPDKWDAAMSILGKRPLAGPKGFAKQRTFTTLKDAMDFSKQNPAYGLEPVSNNPVDMYMLKAREADRALMARDIIGESIASDLAGVFEEGQQPHGWVEVNDRIGKKMSVIENGVKKSGKLYAAKDAATVINNDLSPGLRDKPWFRGYFNTANSLNMFQLGWSAFHLGFTTYDAAVSQFALGLEQIVHGARTKQPSYIGKGLASIAKTPVVPLEPGIRILNKMGLTNRLSKSNLIWREAVEPGSTGNPQIAKMVEMVEQGGGRFGMDPYYRMDLSRQMRRAWKSGNMLSAILKAPGAANEHLMSWLFEYAVPQQKIGAFSRLAEFEMSKLPRNATESQVRDSMQTAWRSVDNRMGQLVYDNLLWNKVAKDLFHFSVRSVGWNVGTIREIGGGAADSISAVRNALKGKSVDFTHRMAYITSLVTLTGMVGGTMHYLNTGKHPQGMDYFFPQTGQLDEYGRPQRIQLPSYLRDIIHVVPREGETPGAYASKVGKTVQGKMQPLLSAVIEMMENEDWQHEQIRNERDNLVQQLSDVGKHVTGLLMPFSWRYSVADMARTSPALGGHARRFSNSQSMMAFFGVTPAPVSIEKPTYEQVIDRMYGADIRRAPATHTEAATRQRKLEVERQVRLGKEDEATRQVQEGVKRGQIKEEDVQSIREKAGTRPVVNHFKALKLEDALDAFKYVIKGAPPEERALMHDALVNKLNNKFGDILSLPEDDPYRMRVLEALRQLNMLTGENELNTEEPPR